MLPFKKPERPAFQPITIHDLSAVHDPRREFALMSLLEMSRELAFSQDLFETVDLLLFNLMGQFGCARSAFWVLGGDDESGPILLKSHGFPSGSPRRIGSLCGSAIHRYLDEVRAPILTDWLRHSVEPAVLEELHQGQYAMFAPLVARSRLLGWIALGSKLDGSQYHSRDVQLLEAALGMVAFSLESALLTMSLRESNRRLRSTNERLTELDRLKSEFMSNVNHELRTPVAVVIATLEALEGAGSANSKTHSLMSGALMRARDLHHLLESLLTFSDLSHAELAISLRMLDVMEFMDTFVASRRPGLTSNLRAIDFTRASGLPPVVCDPARLEQVLNELVDNAVKFTPEGAGLAIATTVAIDHGVPWIRITVTDDGPGIDSETAEHLFESFRQGDGSSQRRFGGLGLGLALCKQLIENMNGRLELMNPGAPGACFAVWLPAGEQRGQPTEIERGNHDVAGPGAKP
jgi:signal transduction histidine kinase